MALRCIRIEAREGKWLANEGWKGEKVKKSKAKFQAPRGEACTYSRLSRELVASKEDGSDLSVLGEDLTELGLLVLSGQVLDENVGPLGISGRDARLARDVLADVDLLIIPDGLVETSDG